MSRCAFSFCYGNKNKIEFIKSIMKCFEILRAQTFVFIGFTIYCHIVVYIILFLFIVYNIYLFLLYYSNCNNGINAVN